jgi:hypothetical protein
VFVATSLVAMSMVAEVASYFCPILKATVVLPHFAGLSCGSALGEPVIFRAIEFGIVAMATSFACC